VPGTTEPRLTIARARTCRLGAGPRTKIRDKVFGFKGHFIAGDARISFSAHDDGSGVVYHSDPHGQRTVSAGVGHERNGVFF
jgi:hypothetical protein